MSSRIADIPVPPECDDTIRTGALVAVNTSGGKDSQAMTIPLSRIVPHGQLVAVHAPLGEVEWQGTISHIEATLLGGVPLIMAPVSSGKSPLDQVEERGRFPGIHQRWCTASHKRGPIEREFRRYLKANSRFGGRLVNCLGIRHDESAARAKRDPWRRNERLSLAGREVFRLAANLRPHDRRRVPRHPRRRTVAALDLPPSVAMQLLLLHFLLARGSAAGGRTPSRPLSALCGDRAAHRTHPVAVGHSSAGSDGNFPVRGRGRRRPDRHRPPSIPSAGDAADLRSTQPPQAPARVSPSASDTPSVVAPRVLPTRFVPEISGAPVAGVFFLLSWSVRVEACDQSCPADQL